jgi:uncharacterized protein with PIN domain
MVIDTSALYAILAGEPERPALIRAIVADPVRLLSAVSLIELLIVVHARMQADGVARLAAISGASSDHNCSFG